jgi:hypothetical protein
VCTFELGDDVDDIDGLPAALRPLVRLCADDEADEAGEVDFVAVGAAMAATYTGVAFGPGTLEQAQAHTLTPPPSDLETYTAQYSCLSDSHDDLHDAVVALPASAQRRLAEWVTRASLDEAGVDDDHPSAVSMTSQYGGEETPQLTPAADALVTRWRQAQSKLSDRDISHEPTIGGGAVGRLESAFADQVRWAGEALRYSSHPDPFSAAARAVWAALIVYRCTRTERHVAFVEDDTGRWHADVPGPVGRETEFRSVLDQLLATTANGKHCAPNSQHPSRQRNAPT